MITGDWSAKVGRATGLKAKVLGEGKRVTSLLSKRSRVEGQENKEGTWDACGATLPKGGNGMFCTKTYTTKWLESHPTETGGGTPRGGGL